MVNDKEDIKIRAILTYPSTLLSHLHEKVGSDIGKRLALVTANQMNRLLEAIFRSRHVRGFAEYQALPNDKGKVNCHTQAVKWLKTAGILDEDQANEWTLIEKKKSACVLL